MLLLVMYMSGHQGVFSALAVFLPAAKPPCCQVVVNCPRSGCPLCGSTRCS